MAFKTFRLAIAALVLTVFITACQNDRISRALSPETGEFYSSDALSSTRSGHSEEERKLQADFDAFCTELFRKEMESSGTLDLHYTLLHPENYGIDAEDAALGTYRLSELIKNSHEIHDLKEKLSEFDPHMLSDDQQILYDSLSERIETGLMAEGLELYDQPLAPTIGIQAQLPILLAEYSFHSLQDVEDYLTLLSQLDSYYGDILYFEEQKAAAGLGPSDASIERILESCQSYLIDPVNNFLTETFETRLNSLSTDISLSEQQKNNFRSRHLEVIKNSFLPAYRHLIDGLSGLKGRGINEGGLCGFRNGRRYYEYLLRSGPGLSYNIEELKAALSDRMQKDLETISSLSKKTGPDLSFRLTDPPAILADLQTQMSGDFPVLSEASKKYEIRYVPTQLESTLSPAFYLTAPLDDPTRNVIYINNGSTSAKDELYPTLAHEGFPGHLYQTVYSSLVCDTQTLPIRKLFSYGGYVEGWAYYTERISYEYAAQVLAEAEGSLGSSYPAALLCTLLAQQRDLQINLFCLLDLSLHYYGTEESELLRSLESFGLSEEQSERVYDYLRTAPAVYLKYYVGYLEMNALKKRAELQWSDNFSLLRFHRFVLEAGPSDFENLTKRLKQTAAKTG